MATLFSFSTFILENGSFCPYCFHMRSRPGVLLHRLTRSAPRGAVAAAPSLCTFLFLCRIVLPGTSPHETSFKGKKWYGQLYTMNFSVRYSHRNRRILIFRERQFPIASISFCKLNWPVFIQQWSTSEPLKNKKSLPKQTKINKTTKKSLIYLLQKPVGTMRSQDSCFMQ